MKDEEKGKEQGRTEGEGKGRGLPLFAMGFSTWSRRRSKEERGKERKKVKGKDKKKEGKPKRGKNKKLRFTHMSCIKDFWNMILVFNFSLSYKVIPIFQIC